MRTFYPGDTVNMLIPDGMGDIRNITLRRARRCISVPYNVNYATNRIEVGPLPSGLCAGVHKVVVSTTCGCHYVNINLPCRGPQLAGTMLDTNDRPVEQVCCEEDGG